MFFCRLEVEFVLLYLFSLVEADDIPKIEYIYNKYHRDMMRLAKHRLKKAKITSYATEAEDVVQNAFVKISKNIKLIDLDVPERALRAYIMSIVANESSNFVADHEYVESFAEGQYKLSENDFFERLCIKERYDEVTRTIEAMDEKYGITLLYRYHKGMTVKQIASLMGIPEKTVYTRLERGKMLLLKLLGEGEDV